jgi:hypothetical protein
MRRRQKHNIVFEGLLAHTKRNNAGRFANAENRSENEMFVISFIRFAIGFKDLDFEDR